MSDQSTHGTDRESIIVELEMEIPDELKGESDETIIDAIETQFETFLKVSPSCNVRSVDTGTD